MKKFLSLILAAMLLMSCTAFATGVSEVDTITNGTKPTDWDGDTGDIDAYDNVNYGDETKYDTNGKAATELWLQVDATGQIDVTVPLVLIFQTNIDGGTASTGTDYQITNNSSANLAVTKIEVVDKHETSSYTQTADNALAPKAFPTSGTALGVDEYAVKLTVSNPYLSTDNESNFVFDFFKNNSANTESLDKIKGGLFELEKAGSDGTSKTTKVDVTMQTGKLSFVTSRATTTDGNDTNDTDADDNGLDSKKGVHLLTVTYTVAISTKDAVGESILGATVSTDLTSATNSSTALTSVDNTGTADTSSSKKGTLNSIMDTTSSTSTNS